MNLKLLLSKMARAMGRARGPGYIDHFDAARVAGWVSDPADPDASAMISLHVDGIPEMNIIADLPREDVQAAGLAPLRCGFDATLPRKLRNGGAHHVELRLGLDGPVLRGGVLRIPGTADTAATDLETEAPWMGPADEAEGMAFFDPHRAAIVGWAIGCSQVIVQFDDDAPETVTPNREVPGFGGGSRQGFRLPVPTRLMDGEAHSAQVRFATTRELLDGAPVRFRLMANRPRVEIEQLVGDRLTLCLRDGQGQRIDQPFTLLADGKKVPTETRGNSRTATLPTDAQHLVVVAPLPAEQGAGGQSDPSRPEPPPDILARFLVNGATLCDIAAPVMQDDSLDGAALEQAGDAFSRFCAAPDSRFDPLWYRGAYPASWDAAPDDTDPDGAALAHYRDIGARAGHAPGPFFDEATARLLHPQVDEAIMAGALPCAFALELLKGPGSLGSLPGLPSAEQRALAMPDMARVDDPAERQAGTSAHQRLAAVNPRIGGLRDRRVIGAAGPFPTPVAARLQPPIQALAPSESIYAAWTDRLDIPEATRAELNRDEQGLRRDIVGTALTRIPLVSIIMPSWNRAFTIGEAIQSVLEQSYGNWELIVSDDASEDKTAEVVRNFDDPRIRYMKFLKSNGAGARNKGLRFARGEYIAYLDSDNIWHPQFLDLMLRRLLAAPGSAIAYGAYLDTEIEGATVQLRTISRPSFRPVNLSSKNFMDLNTIVHHRRVYDWMGGFDNDLPRLQDWDLVLRYTSVFRPIFVNRIGVFYRRNVAWGQVTHLQMNSGAQNTVNEKTHRRLTERHETLNIDWPARGRVTVLAGGMGWNGQPPSIQTLACTESLARLAAGVADVDLVLLGVEQDTADNDPDGLVRHPIPGTLGADPLRLGNALRDLFQGRPVLSMGMRNSDLRAIPTLDPILTYRLRGTDDGTVLQGLDLPTVRFDLGALPLAQPQQTGTTGTLHVLVLMPAVKGPETEKLIAQLQVESQRRGLTLLLPPQGSGPWQMIEGGTLRDADLPEGTLYPDILAHCTMTACLGPVGGLDPFALGLLNTLQGAGVPAAVPRDAASAKGNRLADQWIDAKAAYEIKVNDPKWIFDKLRKLLADPASYDRLAERSRTVHAIGLHPDLVQERLNHALYRLLFDAPHHPEVFNART